MSELSERAMERRTFLKTAFGVGLGALSLPALIEACGSSSTATTSTNQDLLRQIISRGSITSAIWVDPPYEFPDPNNQSSIIGLIPDMNRLMAKTLGVSIELVTVGATTMIAGLQTSKYDMIGASMSDTPQREQAVSFTAPYSLDGMSWFVEKSNSKNLKTLDDLNNAKVTIAVSTGTAGESISRTQFPKATIRSLPNATNATMFSELESGRSDAIAEVSLFRRAVEHLFPTIVAIPDNDAGVDPAPQAWAVRQGSENESLRAFLSGFITQVVNDGTYTTLREKWFTPANTLPGLTGG